MSVVRTPLAVLAAPRIRDGDGLEVAGLRESHPWMDPYLSIDHFVMSEPTIRPHPHAGFSAVTLIFEDSPGSIINRDSLGTVVAIEPGDVHWTQAGSGVIHEEVPSRPPTACHGAQIFVDLPAELEKSPPELYHLEAAHIPVVTLDGGGQVRVISGTFGETRSTIHPGTDVTMLDVKLPSRSTAMLAVDANRTAFPLAIRGHGSVGPVGKETELPPGHAVGFAHDGDLVRIVAGDEGLHLLLGGGQPLRQPAHWVGGLAMSTQARSAAAAQRYHAGDFGHLDPSF